MHWHEWIEGKWAVLFSHPADFTPVCTTEIGRMALKYDYLAGKGVKVSWKGAGLLLLTLHAQLVSRPPDTPATTYAYLGTTGQVVYWSMIQAASSSSELLPVVWRPVMLHHCSTGPRPAHAAPLKSRPFRPHHIDASCRCLLQVAALSCNALDEHCTWMKDVVAHCANKVSAVASWQRADA
jgi:hypothetical protein